MSQWRSIGVEKVEVEGLAELEANLKDLCEKEAKRAVRAALAQASEIVRAQAENNAQRQFKRHTGNLFEGIIKRMGRMIGLSEAGGGGTLTIFRVGLKKMPKSVSAWYGRLLEFGTRKMAAKPFMRPAFDQTKDRALKKIIEVLGRRIGYYQRKKI